MRHSTKVIQGHPRPYPSHHTPHVSFPPTRFYHSNHFGFTSRIALVLSRSVKLLCFSRLTRFFTIIDRVFQYMFSFSFLFCSSVSLVCVCYCFLAMLIWFLYYDVSATPVSLFHYLRVHFCSVVAFRPSYSRGFHPSARFDPFPSSSLVQISRCSRVFLSLA